MHLGKEKWPPTKRFRLPASLVRGLRIRALRTPPSPVREGPRIKRKNRTARNQKPRGTWRRHAIMNCTGLSRHNRPTSACWAEVFAKHGNFPLDLNVTVNVQAAVSEPDAALASPRSY